MKPLALLCVLICVTAQQSSRAQAQSHFFTMYGPTDTSCGGWTTATGQTREIFEWWVLGFVSGADYAAEKRLTPSDSKGIKAWVDKYCAEYPLVPIAKASIDLVKELQPK